MNGKKTLQPVGEQKREPVAGEQSLADRKKELLLELEIQEASEKLEAKRARFKTAEDYLKAVDEQDRILNELNEKLAQVVEREQIVTIREKELARSAREAEKTIQYAEVLKPLGEDRTQIVALLKELRDKVTELVGLPDAFREFNKYGVEKEHDKLFVEIKVLIQTWLDTVRACKRRME
jgi:hypothetical protein